jgi:hypothetical protein
LQLLQFRLVEKIILVLGTDLAQVWNLALALGYQMTFFFILDLKNHGVPLMPFPLNFS